MVIPAKAKGFQRNISDTDPLSIVVNGQKRVLFGNDALTTEGADPNAFLFGYGTSTTPVEIGTTAGKFMSFYMKNSSTTSAEGLYLRNYQGGAGSSGECLRAFSTVSDVAAGNSYGIHASLSFGTSGTVTGLGCAGRFTLHVPSSGAMAGTVTAVQAEIWSDAATSDPAGATTISFFRAVVSGDTDGDDDVLTDAVLFDLSDIGASGGIWTDTTSNAADEFLKVKTPSGIRYLILSDSTTFA
jgi:hypothetical protein